MSERSLTADGPVGPLAVELAYGPAGLAPVLFVHPVNTSGAVWRPCAERLEPPRRWAFFDLRGHGGSVLAGPFTVEGYAADAVAVMDAVGFERAHVVGASLGGPIAIFLAARQPERVVSISLLGSAMALSMAENDLDGIRKTLESEGTEAFLRAVVPAALGAAARDRLTPAVLEMALGDGNRPPEMVSDIVRTAFSSDVSGLTPAVTAPSLVIAGEEDAACTVDMAQATAAALRTDPPVVLPGIGHLPMLEDPDRVSSLLDAHFSAAEAAVRAAAQKGNG